MPFRITMRSSDVQQALTDQGYTAARAPNLDRLDANISTRAAPGDILVDPATDKIDGSQIDAAISSRAAPGAAMDIVAAARAAIWNELIPATPAAGSFGERVKNNLDAAVSTRATPADVDTQLGNRRVTITRMAKLDTVSAQARALDSVTAAGNTAGLTVQLDTGYRTVVEIRYSCGGAADFFVEGSDDGITWYVGDSFSEVGAVTDNIVGYLSARRYIRMRSPTTGIDLFFELVALL